jgi:hypothetical protein
MWNLVLSINLYSTNQILLVSVKPLENCAASDIGDVGVDCVVERFDSSTDESL